MNEDIKTELHKLIDDCDNELLLQETKELLQPNHTMKDWWDELTEDDKSLLLQSEQEYEQGNFISHAGLMQQFEYGKRSSMDCRSNKRFLEYGFLFTGELAGRSFKYVS